MIKQKLLIVLEDLGYLPEEVMQEIVDNINYDKAPKDLIPLINYCIDLYYGR